MITIKYSCPKCGLVNREVQVPAREHVDIDVLDWMKNSVIPCLSDDHARVSPHCHPDSLRNIMIPYPKGSEFAGQQME